MSDDLKISPFGKSFAAKLRRLGFASYHDYLQSDLWRAKRAEYMASDLPKTCLGCGSDRITLHHRTYTRLGREQLLDLLPLCRDCHKRVHEYEQTHKTSLGGTHKILRILFGWTKEEMHRRFAPFTRNGFMGWVDREATQRPKPSQLRKNRKSFRNTNKPMGIQS